MYKLLKEGKTVLLFPGGAREVFKRKGEKYRLFWPQDDFGFVRLAAKLNATILPFSGLGGDDSFELAVDSQRCCFPFCLYLSSTTLSYVGEHARAARQQKVEVAGLGG